jgi:hypothetical protein
MCSANDELTENKFDNLDAWINKEIVPKYEKEILRKLLKEKKPEGGEEKKD